MMPGTRDPETGKEKRISNGKPEHDSVGNRDE